MKKQRPTSNETGLKRRLQFRSKEDVQKALILLSKKGSKAWRIHYKRKRVQFELSRLNRMHQRQAAGMIYSRTAVLLLGCIPVIAVFILDFLLLSAAAEYLVLMAFTKGWIVTVTKIAVPFFIVGLDLCVSTNLLFAGQDAGRFEDAPRTRDKIGLRLWRMFGIAPILVLVCLVTATFLARLETDASGILELDLVSGLILGALAILAMFCHAVVISGGRRALVARDTLDFWMQRWTSEWKLHRLTQLYVKKASRVIEQFHTYKNLLERHNERYPSSSMLEGPYDSPLRIIINDCFGFEVIRKPETGSPFQSNNTSEKVASDPVSPSFRSEKTPGERQRPSFTQDRSPSVSDRFQQADMNGASKWLNRFRGLLERDEDEEN